MALPTKELWPNPLDRERIQKMLAEGSEEYQKWFRLRHLNNSLFGIPLDEVDKVVEADSADSHSRRSCE